MKIVRVTSGIAVVVLLSLLAWGAWLFEILQEKGWPGTAWLNGYMYSSFICTLFVVLAYLLPFVIMDGKINTGKFFIALLLLFAASFICYNIGRVITYMVFQRFFFLHDDERFALLFLLAGIFIMLLVHALVYWVVTRQLMRKPRAYSIVFLFLSVPLAITFAMVTCNYFPGFGTGSTEVDTVKMGYPVLWTVFFIGACGIMNAALPEAK